MCDFHTVNVICVVFVYLFSLSGATQCVDDPSLRINYTGWPGSHVAMGLQVPLAYTRSLEVTWSLPSNLSNRVDKMTIHCCEMHNGNILNPDGICHDQKAVNVSHKLQHIGGLEALKCYVVWLEATLNSGQQIFSTERRLKSTAPIRCDCDLNGSLGNYCDPYTGQCDCKANFHGHYCSFCKPGFYHHNGDATKCDGCPCTRLHSGDDLSCSHDNNGLIKCNHCRAPYSGRLCRECAPGYHRSMHNGEERMVCAPCTCGGHGDTQHPKGQCDNDTGECRCIHNTGGSHCERCAKGFTGVPGNCTSTPEVNKDTTESKSSGGDPTIGAIIGVCVVIGLLVVGLLLYFAWRHYRRWKRQPGQFWTVGLSPETDDLTLQVEHDWHDQYNSRDDSLLIGSSSYVGRFSAPSGEEPNPYRSITVS